MFQVQRRVLSPTQNYVDYLTTHHDEPVAHSFAYEAASSSCEELNANCTDVKDMFFVSYNEGQYEVTTGDPSSVTVRVEVVEI